MADISADSLLPGGEFKATLCSGTLSIASGTSGTLATLTPTGGRSKIRLTLLSVNGTESGISVIADGVTVISGLTLSSNPLGAGLFSIGVSNASGSYFPGVVSHIEAFNTITITKASGSTSAQILYATEQGF